MISDFKYIFLLEKIFLNLMVYKIILILENSQNLQIQSKSSEIIIKEFFLKIHKQCLTVSMNWDILRT